MNDDMINLGKLVITSPHWRWIDGMLTICRLRVVEGGFDYIIGYRSGSTADGGGWYDGSSEGMIPDFRDSGTIGCLLAMVRVAWMMPKDIIVRHSSNNDVWEVSWSGSTHGGICGLGSTEAEALVNALLSANRF